MLADKPMLDGNISEYVSLIAILAVPLLLALTCHEVAHGYVAYLLGDPTAKMAGRLTLNPLKHLDPLGTIIFFIAKIGWAKPVPVNPRYFKDPQKGMLLVAIAGPAANFILAILFAALFHGLNSFPVGAADSLGEIILIPALNIARAGVLVNLILGIFNLLPIPPLDGANVLAGLMPRRMAIKFMSLAKYGFFLILLLVVLGNLLDVSILGRILFPPVEKGMALLGIYS